MARLNPGLFFLLTLVFLVMGWTADCIAQPLLTGEVFSQRAQDIIVPLTSKYRVSISRMVEEGNKVAPGDVVVEFDGTEAATQLEQQEEALRAATAVADRDTARLEKEVSQARFALDQAQVSLELAQLHADIPEGLIGALEHSENQLTLEKATNALENAKEMLVAKRASLEERQQQQALDLRKAELTQRWWREMLEEFSIEATQPGFVIYDSHPWTGAKYQEGDTVRTSFRVAQIADTSDLAIRVWINGVDRPQISAGSSVKIVLDALPGSQYEGKLISIADSTTTRAEWGKATYYVGTVSFEPGRSSGILPGMSVLVEIL